MINLFDLNMTQYNVSNNYLNHFFLWLIMRFIFFSTIMEALEA